MLGDALQAEENKQSIGSAGECMVGGDGQPEARRMPAMSKPLQIRAPCEQSYHTSERCVLSGLEGKHSLILHCSSDPRKLKL